MGGRVPCGAWRGWDSLLPSSSHPACAGGALALAHPRVSRWTPIRGSRLGSHTARSREGRLSGPRFPVAAGGSRPLTSNHLPALGAGRALSGCEHPDTSQGACDWGGGEVTPPLPNQGCIRHFASLPLLSPRCPRAGHLEGNLITRGPPPSRCPCCTSDLTQTISPEIRDSHGFS